MTARMVAPDLAGAKAELKRLEAEKETLPSRHAATLVRGAFDEARDVKATMAEIKDRIAFARVQVARAEVAELDARPLDRHQHGRATPLGRVRGRQQRGEDGDQQHERGK